MEIDGQGTLLNDDKGHTTFVLCLLCMETDSTKSRVGRRVNRVNQSGGLGLQQTLPKGLSPTRKVFCELIDDCETTRLGQLTKIVLLCGFAYLSLAISIKQIWLYERERKYNSLDILQKVLI